MPLECAEIDMSIRNAKVGDAAAIAGLLGQLGYPSAPDAVETRIARMLSEPGQHVLVADDDGRVVGMGSVIVRHVVNNDAPFARLASLIVGEDRRGEGIGHAIVERAEAIARDAGCFVIEVTSAEHRAGAHRFYERLGYEERRRRFLKSL